MAKAPLDLTASPVHLARSPGHEFWHISEQLAETAPCQDLLQGEFPAPALEWTHALSCRYFLRRKDPKFDLAETRRFLESLAPVEAEVEK